MKLKSVIYLVVCFVSGKIWYEVKLKCWPRGDLRNFRGFLCALLIRKDDYELIYFLSKKDLNTIRDWRGAGGVYKAIFHLDSIQA